MVIATVAWVVVLLAGFAWAVLRGQPTAREQTTVEDAIPVLMQAQSDLVRAATADGLAVVALDPMEQSTCDVTVARDGVRLQAPILAFVTAGTEQALMERIVDRLPASYEAQVRAGRVPRLTADAGTWVGITGAVVAPGHVRIVADTGDCRPAGEVVAADPLFVADRGAAQAALDHLGMTAQAWTARSVGCAGGTVATVQAVTADSSNPGALDVNLRDLVGTGNVVSASDLVAYVSGGAGVAVRVVGTRVMVTSTTITCR
jgi:hypothetical protein